MWQWMSRARVAGQSSFLTGCQAELNAMVEAAMRPQVDQPAGVLVADEPWVVHRCGTSTGIEFMSAGQLPISQGT
jgi:hypothetical protein